MFHQEAQQRNKYLQRYQHGEPPLAPCYHVAIPIHASHAFTTKTVPLGYENHELSKIIAKLNDAHCDTQIRILNTLIDALKDTELLLAAIKHCRIVINLDSLLRQTINFPNDKRTALVCETLKLIAKRQIGAEQIVQNQSLIVNIFKCIERGVVAMATDGDDGGRESNAVMVAAANVLEVAAIFPRVAMLMIENGFLHRIKQILDNDNAIENEHLYNVLSILIQAAPPTRAIEQELYFEFLLNKLHMGNAALASVLKCFAVLINCPLGQHLCDIFHVMRKLNEILTTQGLASELYEVAALALQNSTHSDVSRFAVIAYTDLPRALVYHARTKVEMALQIYALQCLRQITENPNVKLIVFRNYLTHIRDITPLSHKAKEIKSKLLECMAQVDDGAGKVVTEHD